MRLFAQRARSGFQTRRRVRQLLVGGLLALSATLFPASIAGAATGDVLRTVVAANPNFCGLNTGVAFDGTNLLETCDANNNINVVSTADGSLVRTVTVPGVSGIGAAAWDAGRGQLWACNNTNGKIMLVDVSTGSETDFFAPSTSGGFNTGCFDGLAYDGADDTLWASADASTTLNHYKLDGTLLQSFSMAGKLAPTDRNSGIAVGGDQLFLANDGGSKVYQAPKDLSTTTLFFTAQTRLEDLECDNVTFAPSGAMWIQDAFDRNLTAVEIPGGLCAFGGAVPKPPSPPSPVVPAALPPVPLPVVPAKASISVAGVGTACVSTSFSPTFSIRAPAGVKKVTVSVDGRRVQTSKKSKFKLAISVRKLKAGRHRITVVAVDARNRTTTQQRSFFRCAQKAAAKPQPKFTG
jgi:hypothetical protein